MFRLDGRFYRLMSRCFDCMVLSLILVIFSLPVVTAGAAASAGYYAVNKVFIHGEGHILQEFWCAFRSSFRQATLVWLVVLCLLAAITGNLYFAMQRTGLGGGLFVFFCVLAALILIWSQYLLACIGRFENSTGSTLKNVLLMSVANPLASVGLLLLLILAISLLLPIFPLSLILIPALYMLAANRLIEEVFVKYQREDKKQSW